MQVGTAAAAEVARALKDEPSGMGDSGSADRPREHRTNPAAGAGVAAAGHWAGGGRRRAATAATCRRQGGLTAQTV
eukprot:10805348-Alexandrium_andersonii.AAC.1